MSSAADITMHITNLRTGPEYQSAIRTIQRADPETIKGWAKSQKTLEYAQLRLAVGIWERIAQIILQTDPDRDAVYPCSPVGLMWELLEPAISVIQENEKLPNYACLFKDLFDDHACWTRTDAGEKYCSSSDQAICALFG